MYCFWLGAQGYQIFNHASHMTGHRHSLTGQRTNERLAKGGGGQEGSRAGREM